MAHLAASELFSVKDMVFVITGGGTGIGAMMAKALDANHAAKIYIIGRRVEKLQEVVASALNKSIIPLQGDITSKESLSQLAAKIESETPFINAVIANSGGQGPTITQLSPTASFSDFHSYLRKTSMEDFNETFMQNSTGMFYTFLAFMPLLHAANTHPASPTVKDGLLKGMQSQFIATSSIGAFSRLPGMGYAYSGSKAAGVHMCKMLATRMVPYDIRVNVIAPGIYPSDMSTAFLDRVAAAGGRDAKGELPQSIAPALRAGSEEDAGGATLFLCSRAGAYLNGNVIITDGGRLSILPSTY